MSELIYCENLCEFCDGTCEANLACRFDDSSDTVMTKNRTVSRKRYLSEKKEKKRQHKSIIILEAKVKRLPKNANNTELNNAAKRVINAYKKNPELKKALKENSLGFYY